MSKVKLKYISKIFTGTSISDNEKDLYVNHSVPYIRTSDIELCTNKINYDGLYSIENFEKFKKANINDTLLCIEGGSAGRKIGKISEITGFGNKLACFTNSKLDQDYLYYSLQSPDFLQQFNNLMTGIIGGVSLKDLCNITINNVSYEQSVKIAKIIKSETKLIDEIILNTSKQVENLNDYKKLLISEITKKGMNNEIIKETNTEWNPTIPVSWSEKKFREIFRVRDERNDNEKAVLLALYTSIGIKPRSELEARGNKAITVLNYKIVKKNDLVINRLLSWMGANSFSEYDGVTSPDYDVYCLNDKKNYHYKYFNYLLRYSNFKDECYRRGRGIMMMRWRTYPKEIFKISLPIPPLEEQIEIANYLDDKCSKINELIKIKKQKIEELNSYKKSLIYEYVTGKKEV